MMGVIRSFAKWAFYICPAAMSAGCLGGLGTAPMELDLAGVERTADVSDLAAVLAVAVTEDGRVRPEALERLEGRLDAQLRKLAVGGPTAAPELYPTYAARWAYWYNARAAWSLKLAAEAGCPRRTCPVTMCRRRFPLDGRSMSLEQIDRILLQEARRSGDFRLAACAPGVLLSLGPMPDRPWSAAQFAGRLGEALDLLVLDRRRFVVDVAERQVRVPRMLWACRDMVLEQYETDYGTGQAALITALRPHAGPAARRRLEEGLGYAVVGQGRRAELAVPRRKRYFPGRIGRVEP
jgi:hypothetical protein